MSDEVPMPKNIIEAIARVMAEMGGIPKMTTVQHQKRIGAASNGEYGVKYAYRSIDQITSLAQPLFGVYGVVIVPNVLDAREVELIINDKPWSDTFVTVRWDVYGPAGVTDKIESVTKGIGRDNSDKGMNKAMTTAYKNLLLRLLCVGDPLDEADHERVENGSAAKANAARQKEAPPKANQTPQDEARAELKAWGIKVESLSAALLQVVKCHGHESVAKVPDSQWPMIITTIKDGRQSNEKFEDHFPPAQPPAAKPKAKPTPLQVVNALAQKWCDGDIKLAKDALKEAFAAACPDYKGGTPPTNDQYELVANYLDGLIAAKEWGKCDKAASNRLFEIAKMGALPLHDGQQLTKQDLDEIIAYMKANPFEEVPK